MISRALPMLALVAVFASTNMTAHAQSKGDQALLDAVDAGFTSVGALLDTARFKAAISEVMKLAGQVNQYLSEQEPWKKIKVDRERAGTVLYTALRCVDSTEEVRLL